MSKHYVYIFTRQDISPEQQAVQTAHATYKLGWNVKIHDMPDWPTPDNTYFTLVGVRNRDALSAVSLILDKFEIPCESFVEPDMDYEVTSIATYPIHEDDRGPLLAFNLLKMKS